MRYKHIIHLQFTGPYTENMAYQENILPKWQKREDNVVEVWTINYAIIHGKIGKVPICKKMMDNGVILRRFEIKKIICERLSRKIRYVSNLKRELEIAKPDFLMVHDMQSATMFKISQYCKEHKEIRLVVDCHADYNNSARSFFSRYFLHSFFYRACARSLIPYSEVFYGTLPDRITFMQEMYGIPKSKSALLVMGADDDIVKHAKSDDIKNELRKKHNINGDDFLVVTGGKIDNSRGDEIISLIKAIRFGRKKRIKLIIFGICSEDYKKKVNELLCENIIYTGWVTSEDTYSYMAVADLVVFPGLHSVMWEQAVAVGTPCVFRDLNGFHHVDLGGNAIFVKNPTEQSLRETIFDLINDTEKYNEMKRVASEKGMEIFSYKKIAERCLNAEK